MTNIGSDPQLIAEARAGDATAFAALQRRHRRAARRAAGALTADRAAADAAVTEAFETIQGALLCGSGPDVAFRTYLLTSLRRVVPGAEDHAESAGAASAHDVAVNAYRTLPERYQAVLWHVEVEGDSLGSVAQTVGSSPGVVAQVLVGARQQFRYAYLQAGIDQAQRGDVLPECVAAQDRMAGFSIGGLATREASSLDKHLAECPSCGRLSAWSGDVGAEVRGSVLPALLGSAAAARYLVGRRPWSGWAPAVRPVKSFGSDIVAHPRLAATALAVALLVAVAGGLGLVHTRGTPSNRLTVAISPAHAALSGNPGSDPPPLSSGPVPSLVAQGPSAPTSAAPATSETTSTSTSTTVPVKKLPLARVPTSSSPQAPLMAAPPPDTTTPATVGTTPPATTPQVTTSPPTTSPPTTSPATTAPGTTSPTTTCSASSVLGVCAAP